VKERYDTSTVTDNQHGIKTVMWHAQLLRKIYKLFNCFCSRWLVSPVHMLELVFSTFFQRRLFCWLDDGLTRQELDPMSEIPTSHHSDILAGLSLSSYGHLFV